MGLSDCLPAIESALGAAVERLAMPPSLADAVAYALLGGGKRLRPMLAWHAAAACGAPGSSALPACVALEMVHAFSLVHDDLPAIDNDDLRRGRPTLHRHAGEAMAILAGDAMLAGAFSSLARAGLPDAARVALLNELAVATSAMIAGQVHDTLGGADVPADAESRLHAIHTQKTGALIRAACRMGGLCALAASGPHAPAADTITALTKFGEAVGLMFQIVDDLIDVDQPTEAAGKRTGKDAAAGKLTYPSVLGRDESRRRVERLAAAAVQHLNPLGPAADGLRELCGLLAARKA